MSLIEKCRCVHIKNGSHEKIALDSRARIVLTIAMNQLSSDTLISVLKNVFMLYCSSIVVLPVLSVFQEQKIWSSKLLPSLSPIGMVKVFAMNTFWMGSTLVGSLVLFPKFLLGKCLGFNCRYEAHFIERCSALVCCRAFVSPKVEIRGLENLPGNGSIPAPVYVANHASQIDLAVVYSLGKEFKWISKDSVRYLPGVGLIMTMSEHVFIIRKKGRNNKSISNMYQVANESIKSGMPMFFFPQGTRRIADRLPFKDGAFNVAMENESQIIPVSIHIPLQCWNSWYPLSLLWGGAVENLALTVHKPIQATKDMDKEDLKRKTYDAIFSVIPLLGEEIKEYKKKK